MAVTTLLKNTQFLKLWGNQVLLQVAFSMCNYTALIILADRTHSPFIQAWYYAAITLPAFLFGLIAGPIVDFVDRKKIMLTTDFLLAILFFCYTFSLNNIFLMLAIAFATSAVARFFIPAEAATLPLIVEEKTLFHANTFFLFTLLGSVLIGYGIAGPLVDVFGGGRSFGEKAPFLIASLCLVIGFFLRLTLKPIGGGKLKLPSTSVFKNTFLLFIETFQKVIQTKRIVLPLLFLIFVELMIGIVSVTLLEYVRRFLLLPLTSVTYFLLLPLMLGLTFGMIFMGKIEKKFGDIQSVLFSIVGVGILFGVLGVLPVLGLPIVVVRTMSSGIAILMGLLFVIIAVTSRTLLQTETPPQMHGRVFSFLDIMIALVTPVPVLVLGFFADSYMLQTLLLFGGATVLLAFYVFRRIKKA